MRLYFKYLTIHFKSQLQYRTSFLLLCLGQFLIPFTVFAGMYFMFDRFGTLLEWRFFEAALCFAVIHLSFSLGEVFCRGFDVFSSLVAGGDFDRVLVRPRNTVLQVLGSKFEFTRIGRLLQSTIVLLWALNNLETQWTLVKVIILICMVLNGVFIFSGIFIIMATFCFWTVQGLEVANVFTDGGREMAQYPLNIYEKWVVKFFTFVIPFGAVSYMPLMYILGKQEGDAWQYMLLPFAGLLFMGASLVIWQFGVRHYRSTGS